MNNKIVVVIYIKINIIILMKINLFLILLIPISSYSQYRGIGSLGFSESNAKEFYINENEIIAKEITFSNFTFKEDLIKLDFDRDIIFIENHSNIRESYQFKYFYLKKSAFGNQFSQTDYYLKKTDSLFEKHEKIEFKNCVPVENLINEVKSNGINVKNIVFVYKLNSCYILVNNLGKNKYEITSYYYKKQVSSDIVNHDFLNEFFIFDMKLFLKFDDYVFVVYLYK